MTDLFSLLTGPELVAALTIALVAGLIKGCVGFAMPMILVSGLGTFLPPDVALAGLILPTFVSNAMQALRHGAAEAIRSVARFRLYMLVALVFLLGSAQLVTVLPVRVMLLIVGVPITGFALFQLFGVVIHLSRRSPWIEATVGAFAGFVGGLSGVWGPPTTAYLTALNTPKGDQMRVQGVMFGLGSVALLVAHSGSGVLRAETVPLTVALTVPAILGMLMGQALHDRVDQATFRKVTLIVLTVAGLNIVRRGLGF